MGKLLVCRCTVEYAVEQLECIRCNSDPEGLIAANSRLPGRAYFGQTMGVDMDSPPEVLPTAADQADISSDALIALFNALWEAFVPLGPTIR